MGKYSEFERKGRDFYATYSRKPIEILAEYLPKNDFTFIEPMAGAGHLTDSIVSIVPQASCIAETDILPMDRRVAQHDLRDLVSADGHMEILKQADFFITNPPWKRTILHETIMTLSAIRPTWLLIDSNWVNTQQAKPYLEHCRKIVALGRIKWIPDSKGPGKEDSSFYLFDQMSDGQTQFYPYGGV